MTSIDYPKFRVGDKVVLIKNAEQLEITKGTEGFVVCIPRQELKQRTFRIGVDFGTPRIGLSKLGYYDERGLYVVPLKRSSGAYLYQSYLALAGPPDDGDDWI